MGRKERRGGGKRRGESGVGVGVGVGGRGREGRSLMGNFWISRLRRNTWYG